MMINESFTLSDPDTIEKVLAGEYTQNGRKVFCIPSEVRPGAPKVPMSPKTVIQICEALYATGHYWLLKSPMAGVPCKLLRVNSDGSSEHLRIDELMVILNTSFRFVSFTSQGRLESRPFLPKYCGSAVELGLLFGTTLKKLNFWDLSNLRIGRPVAEEPAKPPGAAGDQGNALYLKRTA